MEALSYVHENIQSYWRRRAYKRLEPASKQKTAVIRLGGGKTSTRRTWTVRVMRPLFRIRVKIPSPLGLLARLRDVYVDGMLTVAGGGAMQRSSSVRTNACPRVVWGKRVPRARPIGGAGRGDFDARMMLYLYNSIVNAPRELR